jgi:hypothetical protein
VGRVSPTQFTDQQIIILDDNILKPGVYLQANDIKTLEVLDNRNTLQLLYKEQMINNFHENGCCTVHEMVESTCIRIFSAQQFCTEGERERDIYRVRYCCVLSSVVKRERGFLRM